MKTYNIIKGIFAATVLSVVFSGCSEDAMDRINKDHGHTQSVAARFILTDVITSTAFSNAGGDFNTYLSAYIEYEVGVDNQLYYAETRESEPTSSSTFNNTWNGLYSTLKSARIIINQCSEGGIDHGNYVTKGMAEVLAAYNCALIADMFGDAPCSQAALIDENGSPVYLTPKMDKQEEIYTQAMQYLDDAIADLQKEDLIDPEAQDLLYQGDAEKWLKLAYGLKARYTMHLLKRSANKDADMEKVLEYVDNSFESAEEQAAFDVYDANNINPLYGFFVARAGLGASESMRSKLAEYNDPRLSRAFITKQGTSGKEQAPGTADNAVYAPNGTPEQGTSQYGTSLFMYSISAPTLLLSYHELKFLEAEALCRLERDAKSALKDAVVAGLLNIHEKKLRNRRQGRTERKAGELMYNFVDTTERYPGQNLPSEALMFNGNYLENVIPGYRTLYVSGREVLGTEITDLETGVSDGTKYRRKRYQPRTIVVGYQLIAEDNSAFRSAYNKLNALLDEEQATLIFADEPDKYYIGTKQGTSEVPAGRNAITAELEFYCADPFKYSVEEFTVNPTADDGKTFIVSYNGTYRAFPKLQAVMHSENGVVGFVNDSKKILQFGDPDELNGETYKKSELITSYADQYVWSQDAAWKDDTGSNFLYSNSKTAGKLGVMSVDSIKGLYLASSGYVSPNTNGWNGAMKSIDVVDSNGAKGATHLYCYMNSWFETGLMGQTGCQAIAFCDANGKMICCQEIYKTDTIGNTAHMNMWVGGNNPRIVKTYTFEPCHRKDANPYSQTYGASDMMKHGEKIRFFWKGSYPEFTVPELKDVKVATVKLYLGQWGSRNTGNQLVTRNYFRGIFVRIDNVEKWRDIPNKFSVNQVLTADCSNGEVMLQGLPRQDLGALGNDWENFCLQPGMNQIQCIASDWATQPTYTMKYREVFL